VTHDAWLLDLVLVLAGDFFSVRAPIRTFVEALLPARTYFNAFIFASGKTSCCFCQFGEWGVVAC
jgi:hypothetical protein